jgi:predicted nucleic acid-binding Zn ribbon protein
MVEEMRCPNCSMGIVEPGDTCGMCGIEAPIQTEPKEEPTDNYKEFLKQQKEKRKKRIVIISICVAVLLVMTITASSILILVIKGDSNEKGEVDLEITSAWMKIYQNEWTGYRSADLFIIVKNNGDTIATKENITISYSPAGGESTKKLWRGDDLEPGRSETVEYGFGPAMPGNYYVGVYYQDELQHSSYLY